MQFCRCHLLFLFAQSALHRYVRGTDVALLLSVESAPTYPRAVLGKFEFYPFVCRLGSHIEAEEKETASVTKTRL